ncbi:MAG: hypothetical protein FWE90_02980 [Defluviitaleaceae bacterium]|nr:hypothetical protein [Defluviitaleaceae bacterium]
MGMMKNPGLPPKLQQHRQYVEDSNFNYDRFTLIDIYPQCEDFAVILFYENNGVKPWSIQFRGSGRYFYTREELDEYCKGRKFKGWV